MPYTHPLMLDQVMLEQELSLNEQAQDGHGVSRSAGEEATSSGAATILVAEDDPAVRVFVNAVLEQAGYEVILAENGRKSLEICKNYPGPIHVLVADVVMPETNGRELAERAKIIRPELKVLFISGYVDRALKENDADDPSYAFLEKPFSAQSLVETIARFHVAVNAPE